MTMLLQANGIGSFISDKFADFLTYTGFANVAWANLIMIVVGAFFIWLAIKKDFEPLLLIPIGLGIILGNIPFKAAGLEIGLYEDNSVLNIFYQGVRQGWYPPLVFLGIGAMTDFSALIANPKLMLVGAAAQFGIFGAYIVALLMGFEPNQAAGIAIIGGADGPTAIFLSSKLSPNLMGAIAVCAYSYMALVPVIQPFIMRSLTTKKEKNIKMSTPRQVSQTERILFPIVGLLITTFIVPSGLPLLGMLFFGNLLKESTKTTRLAKTAGSALNDIVVMLLGLTVGCYAGKRIPHDGYGQDFRVGSLGLHDSDRKRRAFREIHEPLLAGRKEDESVDWERWRERSSHGGAHLQPRRASRQSAQLPADARHGAQRGRRDRLGRGGGRAARFPLLSTSRASLKLKGLVGKPFPASPFPMVPLPIRHESLASSPFRCTTVFYVISRNHAENYARKGKRLREKRIKTTRGTDLGRAKAGKASRMGRESAAGLAGAALVGQRLPVRVRLSLPSTQVLEKMAR